MKLPYSYRQITVKKYQQIHKFLKPEMEMEDWINIISILSGKPMAEVEELSLKKLKLYLRQLSFLNELPKAKPSKFIRRGFRLYKATTNAEDLNTAQYTSIKTFFMDGQGIPNLDKICSCVYSELTIKGFKYKAENFNRSCEDFSNCSIAQVYGVVFFCSIALTNLMQNSRDYLQSKQLLDQRMKDILAITLDKDFLNFGVGTQQ